MTAHSGRGQGEQPLYEGVVLPANGDPWTPEQQRQADETRQQPAAGQPWGQPWGPESQAAVSAGDSPAAPLPPPPPQQPPAVPPQQPLPDFQEPGSATDGRLGGGTPMPPPAPQPADLPPASAPSADATAAAQPPQSPHVPQPPAAPGVPEPHGGQSFYGDAQPQPAPQAYQQPGQSQAGQPQAHFASAQPAPAADADATQYIPPVAGGGQMPGGPAAGQPPVAEADATQVLPPQTGASGDPESTAQLRSPLPPEAPADGPNQNAPSGQAAPAPMPQPQAQPPAGFESLFRSEPGSGQGAASGGSGEPGATQSLPLFDHAVARQRGNGVGGLGKTQPAAASGQYGQGPGQAAAAGQFEPQGRAARRNVERGALSRISPGILIGVGVAVVAGVGMAAGAALSGGEKETPKSESKPAAESASEKSAGPDPAEAQAKELDKLLADSNNSRAAVIRSVENIKSCKKLKQAASDLRAAAGQRNGLVSRLAKIETDEIPKNAELRSSLTRAWKASAAADNHYATWADQAAGKKGCKKGKARPTTHTGLGARSSGQATAAKKQAAQLWNPTAKKYGLKQRQVGEL